MAGVSLLVLLFSGMKPNPDEDRLLKHLFDPEYQPHNLKTTPISSTDEKIDVTVSIEIRKLITLVKSEILLTSNYSYWLISSFKQVTASRDGSVQRAAVRAFTSHLMN